MTAPTNPHAAVLWKGQHYTWCGGNFLLALLIPCIVFCRCWEVNYWRPCDVSGMCVSALVSEGGREGQPPGKKKVYWNESLSTSLLYPRRGNEYFFPCLGETLIIEYTISRTVCLIQCLRVSVVLDQVRWVSSFSGAGISLVKWTNGHWRSMSERRGRRIGKRGTSHGPLTPTRKKGIRSVSGAER